MNNEMKSKNQSSWRFFFFTLILNSDLFLEDVPHLAVGALSKINIVIVKKEYYKID